MPAPRTDHVGTQPPFAQAPAVLPILACFRFPNGAAFAGPLEALMRIAPNAIHPADVVLRSRKEALRWAMDA